MKLVEFNPENTLHVMRGKATFRIYRKEGRIVFSKQACQLLKFKKGIKLLFYKDEENTSSWFIRLSSAGFPIFSSDDKIFSMHNKTLSNSILDSIPKPENETIQIIGISGFCINETEIVIDGAKYFPFSTDKTIGAR